VLSDGYLLGQDLERAGKDRQAATAYGLAVASDSQDLSSWRALAHLYQRLGHADYARSCWLAIVKQSPEDDEARAWLAAHAP
jgi:Tfp pilus assembly protein PilF